MSEALGQRGEALVAAPAQQVVGEGGACEGDGRLGPEGLEGGQDGRREPGDAEDQDHPELRCLGGDGHLDGRAPGDGGRDRGRRIGGPPPRRQQLDLHLDADDVDGEGPRRLGGDVLDARPVGDAAERGGGLAEHPLPEQGLLLVVDALAQGPDQAGHAGQHQQEQHGRCCGRHRERAVGVLDGLGDPHPGGDQGGRGQGDQAATRQRRPGLGGLLAQAPHAGKQRSGTPQEVVGQPAGVEEGTLGVAGVQLDVAVHGVGDQQAHHADAQEVEARGAGALTDDQAGDDGQEHDVHQRVGDRHDPLGEGQPEEVGVGVDDEDPGEQAEAHGDDRRVQQAGPVLARRTGPDEDQQAGDQQRVDAEVEEVTDGWELEVEGVVEDVADDEGDLRRREQDPRGQGLRAVDQRADEDGDGRRQPDEAEDQAVAPHPGHGEVPHNRQNARREIGDTPVALHTCLCRLRSFRAE
jgi:hypothetical protein